MVIGIVVHGGAGHFLDDEYPEAVAACKQAAAEAHALLKAGGSALDAVEAAARILELAPVLNAGYGATINSDNQVECDALIQDGMSQRYGAVAGIRRIAHPISLARMVMERTPHHFLIGQGAEDFALEEGMSLIHPKSLLTERQIKGAHATEDTIGAVALDSHGNIAVAVSTGGVRGKRPGRVGDTPIAGAGGYADNKFGGASATGLGEGIMRSLLCFRAVEGLANGSGIQQTADAMIKLFTERFNGDGGIIMLDREGKAGIAHNTPHMPVAWLEDDEVHGQFTRNRPE